MYKNLSNSLSIKNKFDGSFLYFFKFVFITSMFFKPFSALVARILKSFSHIYPKNST